MNCLSHFPFYKTDSVKQMSFHYFLRDERSFHYIFYQHAGYAALYILPLRLLNWLTSDISLPFSVMQISNFRSWQRALSFQSVFTLGSSKSGPQLARGARGGHMIVWRMTFYQTIFSCEYGWVQTVFRSIVFSVHMCWKVSALPYKLLPPSLFHPITSSLSLSLSLCSSPHLVLCREYTSSTT